MLSADANAGRLLEPFLQIGQRAIRLFTQLTQQRGLNLRRYPAHHSMTALCDPLHLLAAQPLSGYLLGPVIADRKQLRQFAQRPLLAIIGRQQLATKIIRVRLRHLNAAKSRAPIVYT